MDDPVTIILFGEPVAWARTSGGKTRSLFTPKKQRNNAAMLRLAAQDVMNGRPPIQGQLRLSLSAEFAIPKHFSKAKREKAIRGELRPTKRPDLSNVLKQCEDAWNRVVFDDDSQIVEHRTRKVYSLSPKLIATVEIFNNAKQPEIAK